MLRFVQSAARSTAAHLAAAIVLGSGLLSLHVGVRPVHAQQQVDRVGVLRQYWDAGNRGDIDGVLQTFTANATLIAGGNCSLATPCQGTDALRARHQVIVGQHQIITLTDYTVTGSVVHGRIEIRSDDRTALGVERTESVFLAQIPQDRITVLVAQSDLADPLTAKFVAANQPQPGARPAP